MDFYGFENRLVRLPGESFFLLQQRMPDNIKAKCAQDQELCEWWQQQADTAVQDAIQTTVGRVKSQAMDEAKERGPYSGWVDKYLKPAKTLRELVKNVRRENDYRKPRDLPLVVPGLGTGRNSDLYTQLKDVFEGPPQGHDQMGNPRKPDSKRTAFWNEQIKPIFDFLEKINADGNNELNKEEFGKLTPEQRDEVLMLIAVLESIDPDFFPKPKPKPEEIDLKAHADTIRFLFDDTLTPEDRRLSDKDLVAKFGQKTRKAFAAEANQSVWNNPVVSIPTSMVGMSVLAKWRKIPDAARRLVGRPPAGTPGLTYPRGTFRYGAPLNIAAEAAYRFLIEPRVADKDLKVVAHAGVSGTAMAIESGYLAVRQSVPFIRSFGPQVAIAGYKGILDDVTAASFPEQNTDSLKWEAGELGGAVLVTGGGMAALGTAPTATGVLTALSAAGGTAVVGAIIVGGGAGYGIGYPVGKFIDWTGFYDWMVWDDNNRVQLYRDKDHAKRYAGRFERRSTGELYDRDTGETLCFTKTYVKGDEPLIPCAEGGRFILADEEGDNILDEPDNPQKFTDLVESSEEWEYNRRIKWIEEARGKTTVEYERKDPADPSKKTKVTLLGEFYYAYSLRDYRDYLKDYLKRLPTVDEAAKRGLSRAVDSYNEAKVAVKKARSQGKPSAVVKGLERVAEAELGKLSKARVKARDAKKRLEAVQGILKRVEGRIDKEGIVQKIADYEKIGDWVGASSGTASSASVGTGSSATTIETKPEGGSASPRHQDSGGSNGLSFRPNR